MYHRLKWFGFVIAICALSACNESKENDGPQSCSVVEDCKSETEICINQRCIERCTETSCAVGEVCAESGICVKKIEIDEEPECSATRPCTEEGKVCSVDYVCVTAECSIHVPCKDETKICNALGVCVAKKPVESDCREDASLCKENQVCNKNGVCEYAQVTDKACSSEEPCVEDYAVCNTEGRCQARCLKGTCPAGSACAEDGMCFEAECSTIDTCEAGKFCQNNRCVTRDELVCYENSDCGEGYGCDQNKCVDAESCSMTRTCSDERACHEGRCVEKTPLACNADANCGKGEKCIAGSCVACSCAENEVCLKDGSCVQANHSDLKNVSKGDVCTWSADYAFCDGNRVFNCVRETGSETFNVTVTNCGARICGTTSEEGTACHDPCVDAQIGDFWGNCIEYYGGMSCFTHTCEAMPEGGSAWTLTDGYEDCLLGYSNGRCNYVPEDFNQPCTTTSYPDSCQGNWLKYCYSTSSSALYGGITTGTACGIYGEDAFCALPGERALALNPSLIGDCVHPCTKAGESVTVCQTNEDGDVFSVNYLCALSTDGRLGYFANGIYQCTKSCHPETGTCNE